MPTSKGRYAHEPRDVAEAVRRCVETGVAGLSIEDFTGDRDRPLYDIDQAVARVPAARAAIDASGADLGGRRRRVVEEAARFRSRACVVL
jgi:2-methylisocitrate lyase-like PEP mutase family enzyme